MDVNLVKDLINNLGFPIAMVGYFIWDKYKSTNSLIETIKCLQDTISNNTLVLNKLLVKIDKDDLIED